MAYPRSNTALWTRFNEVNNSASLRGMPQARYAAGALLRPARHGTARRLEWRGVAHCFGDSEAAWTNCWNSLERTHSHTFASVSWHNGKCDILVTDVNLATPFYCTKRWIIYELQDSCCLFLFTSWILYVTLNLRALRRVRSNIYFYRVLIHCPQITAMQTFSLNKLQSAEKGYSNVVWSHYLKRNSKHFLLL